MCHVTNDEQGIVNCRLDRKMNTAVKYSVYWAEKSDMMVLRVARMKEDNQIMLKRVFFVLQFQTKIISVKKLTKHEYDVTFPKFNVS